jgi:PAS domain S-box-containing protein
MSNILVAFDHKENSRLLFEYLGQYHTVVSPASPDNLTEPFDLGIFDGQALNRLWQGISHLKESSGTLFLPVLLVTGRQEISLITRQLWRVIDEIIVIPIDKTELLVRVEILLRARRLSLELEGKNLQLEQEVVIRREAEQALRESEERFRVTLKNSPMFVAHTDADLRYNWTYNAHYAFDSNEVIGKRDEELLPEATASRLMDLKRQVLETELGMRGEIAIGEGDESRDYDVTVEPIYDADGKKVGTTMVAFDITERKQSEEKSHALIALEERQRLARDLHDSVNQTLFTVHLIADSLPYMREKNPERMWEQINELRTLTQAAMAEMRTLLLELRPAGMTKISLSDLFQQLIRSIQGRREIEISCEINIEQPLSEDVHIALYRIVQEALNNISKHSEATQGRITLVTRTSGLELRIWDNGKGFDPKQAASGMGLGVMRERALIIGAALEVVSSAEDGTAIIVVVSGDNGNVPNSV